MTRSINTKLFYGIVLSVLFLSACENKHSKSAETAKATPGVDMAAFFDAALNGQLQMVKNALPLIGNVDTLDENGHTALMLAAYNGHTELVRFLLEKGADVNRRDPEGRSPLMFAASGPFHETVTLLLEKGADVNMADNGEHFTPLMYAAAEGHLEVVKALMKHGASAVMKDVDGDTAESFARKNGHTQVAEFIKEYDQ